MFRFWICGWHFQPLPKNVFGSFLWAMCILTAMTRQRSFCACRPMFMYAAWAVVHLRSNSMRGSESQTRKAPHLAAAMTMPRRLLSPRPDVSQRRTRHVLMTSGSCTAKASYSTLRGAKAHLSSTNACCSVGGRCRGILPSRRRMISASWNAARASATCRASAMAHPNKEGPDAPVPGWGQKVCLHRQAVRHARMQWFKFCMFMQGCAHVCSWCLTCSAKVRALLVDCPAWRLSCLCDRVEAESGFCWQVMAVFRSCRSFCAVQLWVTMFLCSAVVSHNGVNNCDLLLINL